MTRNLPMIPKRNHLSSAPRASPLPFTLSPTKPPSPPPIIGFTVNTIPLSSPNICWWTPLNSHHNGYHRVKSYTLIITRNFGLTGISRMWENVEQISCLCEQGFFQFDKEFEYAQFLTDEKYIMKEILGHKFTTSGVRCGPWRRKGESYDISKDDQLGRVEGKVELDTKVDDEEEGKGDEHAKDAEKVQKLGKSAAMYTFGRALDNREAGGYDQ